jgi:glycosyltransferase involved in cell wall biosynthesis
MEIALTIFVFMLLLIQYYYAFLYFLPFNIYLNKEKVTGGSVANRRVSILVAAHNELINLKKLVPALLQQQYSDYEIIIALDRCSDGSVEWLKTIADSKLQIIEQHIIKDGIHPKKQIIESGVGLASGEIILLTDADCIPVSENWVQTMASEFEEEKTRIVIGYSPYKSLPGVLNSLVQYETLHTAVQYLSFALQGKGYMAVGRNWAYRKAHFLETGFGDTASYTGGDDDLLFQRMACAGNYRICVSADAWVVSEPPLTWKHWFRQKIRHLSAGKRYKKSNRWDLGVYTSSWLLYLPTALMLACYNYPLAIIFFIARILVFATIFRLIAIRLKSKLYWFVWVHLDIFYNLCYFILALSVLLSKKIQWK